MKVELCPSVQFVQSFLNALAGPLNAPGANQVTVTMEPVASEGTRIRLVFTGPRVAAREFHLIVSRDFIEVIDADAGGSSVHVPTTGPMPVNLVRMVIQRSLIPHTP